MAEVEFLPSGSQVDDGDGIGNSDDIPLDPEIKIEMKATAEGNDLDAILDELEDLVPTNVDVDSVMVSSTFDEGDLDMEQSHLQCQGGSDIGLNAVPPMQLISHSMPSTSYAADSVHDSLPQFMNTNKNIDKSTTTPGNVSSSSSGEDKHVVSSTTNLISLPVHRKRKPSLSLWRLNKTTGPVQRTQDTWKFTCKICGYASLRYNTLYGHFRRFHPRIIRNGKLFKHYSKSTGHLIKKKVPILYVCPDCNYVTLSMNGFTIHCTRRHPRRRANPLKNGSPISTLTNRKYLEALYRSKNAPQKYQENIWNLLETYHPDSKVLTEQENESSRGRRKLQMSANKRQKKCILCGEKFSVERLLNKHYRLSHPEQGPKMNRVTGLYYCKLCAHDAVSRSALRLHYSRLHSMDAFYTWNVPSLEEHFREKEQTLKGNGTSASSSRNTEAKNNMLLEKLDAFMPTTVRWDVKLATENQIAESRVPCILCDFSRRNLVELFSHYQSEHKNSYPKGLKSVILESLMVHVKSVNLKVSDVHLAYGPQGAWLGNNDQIMQIYKNVCQICMFKCTDFEDMTVHFRNMHPNLKPFERHIESIKSSGGYQDDNICKCHICEFTTDNPGNEITLHYRQAHAIALDPSDLILSSVSKVNKYKCSLCDFKGDREATSWHHAQCHDSSVFHIEQLKNDNCDDENTRLTCFACGFSCERSIDLAFHYQNRHFYEAMTFTTPIHDDGYQCLICMAITSSLRGMIRHHWKHVDVTGHRKGVFATKNLTLSCLYCKHCRRVFANTQNLWTHITDLHCPFSLLIRVAELPSHFMKYGFWSQENRPARGEETLEGRLLRSDLKPDLFSDTDLLVRNPNKNGYFRRGHFSDEIETLQCKCEKCYLNFDTQKELSQHICTANSIAADEISPRSADRQAMLIEKRVQCKFCPLTTTHHQNLRRHLQAVHRHDVSFRCFKCSNETISVADCVKHHSNVHSLNIGRPTALNFLLNDIITYSEGRAKYMCCWCGYKGFSRTVVLNHLNSRHVLGKGRATKHKKAPRYYCKWCEYRTRFSVTMREHVSTFHDHTISYHTLHSFLSNDSDTCRSDDDTSDDDEEYIPSPQHHRRKHISLSPRKSNFTLVEDCRFEEDSDFSGEEVFRSTHKKCKHLIRYPLLCKFCMNAFVCSTKFLRHCEEQHSHWCSVSSGTKHIRMLPDAKAIPAMQKKLSSQYERDCSKSVFRDSDWPCEICRHLTLDTAVELQEHIAEIHNGRMMFMCSYCEFVSFSEKKTVLHSHQHTHKSYQADMQVSQEDTSPKDTERMSKHMIPELEAGYKSDSDIEVISDNAGEEMPDLEPVVLNDVYCNELPSPDLPRFSLSPESRPQPLGQRAKKSIRRNSPLSEVKVWGGRRNECLSHIANDDTSKDNYDSLMEDRDLLCDDDISIQYKHSVAHAGIIRCTKCEFCCTDPERMSAHITSTHISTKVYACKFCDFSSDGFMRLDDHLAEFHNIKRNHQLGLQLRFAMDSNLVTTEAASQSILDMKSRFLYTPTPCLPIVQEKVKYLPVEEELVSEDINNNIDQSLVREQDAGPSTSNMEASRMKKVGHDQGSAERFRCAYCGHVSTSTHNLEIHMMRHERNFQQDLRGVDGMSYSMNKMGMVFKFP